MTLRIYDKDSGYNRDATKKEVRAIRNHLQKLAQGSVKPVHNRAGICHELSMKYNISTISLCEGYIDTWPKLDYTTCDCSFPIRDKNGNYYSYGGLGNFTSMWDRRTTVGKLRHELAKHIADELSKELCRGVYTDD